MKNIILMLSLLLLFNMCQNKQSKNEEILSDDPDTITTTMMVAGMTCDHCEMTVQGAANELSGLVSIKADHEDSSVVLSYDASKVSLQTIEDAINKKGYTVLK